MKTTGFIRSIGLALVTSLGLSSPVLAADSFSIEAGAGDRTYLLRAALQWDWDKKWFHSNGTHLSGYWDLSGAAWKQRRYRDIPGNANYLFDVGITPVFRFQRDDKRGLYGEAAIGIHYLSELYNNNGGRLSTRFQFGDHIGIGYVFSNKIDVGLRIQHISNGSIKKPNSGVDFAILRIAYPF